jgi:hypothetical protein
MKTWICKQLGGLLLIFSCTLYGKEPQVLIVYPKVEEPLHSIYASTIKGIEKKTGQTELLEVPEGNGDLQGEIDRRHPDIIIALGKLVADTITKSTYRNQTLVGMVHSNPSEFFGVSLALDSQGLASRLSQLAPFIKKVYAVQERSHPAITPTSDDMPMTSPPIIIKEGADMVNTIRLLGQLVEQDATTSDAVLVPANLPGNILFEISKIAWDRHIVLLSTNLAQLESGVLMVFYPDEVGLGEQLGALANTDKFRFENLKSLHVGLNQRVAQHLNLTYDAPALEQFSVKLK